MTFEQMGDSDNNKEILENGQTFEEAFSWESDLATIEMATAVSKKKLRSLGWPSDDAEDFSLAVREAVQNAVVHGNLAEEAEENKKKRVQAVFKFTNDMAIADIKDEGDFVPDGETLSDPFGPKGLLSGSGRGIGLIGMKVDGAEFFPGRIVLTKYRNDNKDSIEKRRPISFA